MTLFEANDHYLIFELSERQKDILERLLRMYPVSSSRFHSITHTIAEAEIQEEQVMLDEALAESRRENRRNVGNFLRAPNRFEKQPEGWHLKIRPLQVNWLLQVFNEIRIGYWHQLGCPQEAEPELTADTAEKIFFMDLCGHFQMVLLSAGERI